MSWLAPKTVELDEVEAGLRKTGERVRDLTEDLSPEQLSWSPDPQRWSVAQCLEHLVTTDELYRENVEKAIARGIKPPHGSGGYALGRLRLWERLFVGSLEPPVTMRFPAPKIFRPEDRLTQSSEVPAGDSPGHFQRHQERLLESLERARVVDLDRTRVTSPVSGLIRLRLGAAFALVEVHQRRHLEQIRQVAQHPGFPAGDPQG